MKLVLITNQFPKFSETFIVTKFLGLLEKGWDAHVICNRSDEDQWALFSQLATRPDLRGRVRLCPERRLVTEALRDLEPDIVHFEFGGLTKNRIDLPALVGARTVVSFRGPDLNVGWMDDPALYEPVWRQAHGFHFLGRDLERRAAALGCPPRPTALIPPAVDTEFFDGRRTPHAGSTGTAHRPLRILSVGRLHWMKGYGYALRAVRTLLDVGLQCEYTIIGAHDHREHLLEILFDIEDLGLQDVVKVLGRQPREVIRAEMASADVLVHAAVSEGFCNAVIEAQAMRLPAVVSDAGGLPDNVRHGHSGYVTPRRSPRALSNRLQQLACDPTLRQRLGDGGRRRALENFSLEGYAERFHALYTQVLGPEATGADQLRERLAAKERLVRNLERKLPRKHRETLRFTQYVECAEHIERLVPPDGVVAIASRGDDELLRTVPRRALHFPSAPDGAYTGHHPGSDGEAIALLDAIRRAGAGFLAFPKTSLWWLEHYGGFARHLAHQHDDLSSDAALCRVYRLRQTPNRRQGA